MACHTIDQVLRPQQQGQHHDILLNAVTLGALDSATSPPDSPTPPISLGVAVTLGGGEERDDEIRANLIYIIDSVFDILDADDFSVVEE